MTSFHVIAGGAEVPVFPVVRKIGFADLGQALAKGFDDFRAMPSHLAFLAVVYIMIGVFLYPSTSGQNALPLLFPIFAGYALIGPFAAIGLYEVSRRREEGRPHSWRYAFSVLRSPALPSILAVGLALMVIFLLWLASAQALYEWLFGAWAPRSYGQFFNDLLHTQAGHTLIALGIAVGFVYAAVAFCVGVVSFPLLLDQDVGAAIAILTSIRAVLANPAVMAAWAFIVAAALILGFATFFVGLAVVTPILGHATWHLYRRVIAPADPSRTA